MLFIERHLSCLVNPGSVRAILPGRSGAVLTGGSDKCLRFWNPKAPEESYIVTGVPTSSPAVPIANMVRPPYNSFLISSQFLFRHVVPLPGLDSR